jgi:DNA-3-methyladenine glycosylase II
MEHIEHLSKDKKLKKIIEHQAPFTLQKRKHVHLQLCFSIMSQQLSTKVAAVLQERFIKLFNSKTPNVAAIVEIPVTTLRGIGLSNAKAGYVLNVCNFFIAHNITDAQLQKMDSEAIIEKLTQIKGVGRWTVKMILMFTLGREDVFAVDDLGIQQAMCRLYKIDDSNKKAMKEKMLQLSKKWYPYQTYACRYLWNWKDDV